MPSTIRKRLATSVALISLAALTLVGCGSTAATTTTTTPTSTPSGKATQTSPTAQPGGQQTQAATIGETVTVEGKWQMAVVNFRLFTPPSRTPTAGNQFVAAEVNVKNISAQALALSETGHFTLSDTAGTHFADVYVGGISLDLSKTINAGDQQHAVVAFEAPITTSQFILTFTGPGTQSTVDYVHWNLSLQ